MRKGGVVCARARAVCVCARRFCFRDVAEIVEDGFFWLTQTYSHHYHTQQQDADKKRKQTRTAPPQQPPAGPQRVPGALNDLQLLRADGLAETARCALE